MALATIQFFGDYQVAQTLIFPGSAGTPARLHLAGFVFSGLRSPQQARIAPIGRFGLFAIPVNAPRLSTLDDLGRLRQTRPEILVATPVV
jgi:hypothetical protein